jgi:hypothetical protein
LRFSWIAPLTLFAFEAPLFAQGLDRDTLLTEAPATPAASTVRIAGIGAGSAQTDASGSQISGNVMWAPIENLAVDIGAYWQAGTGGGPTARARYQILSQRGAGIDLAAGLRYKSVGFSPKSGEVEVLLAAGRRFGDFDLVLNGVFGKEVTGDGMDVEAKGFAGYHFGENVRAGVDGRVQIEVADEAATGPKVGRDYDLTAGPAMSLLITSGVQVQALLGVSQPKGTTRTSPIGVVGASVDF